MSRPHLRLAAVTAGLLFVAANSNAQILYSDNMESGAGWGVNASSGDSAATFGYDYSADDIPEAPNSQGGDAATTGVKLEANLTAGALDVFTLYPIGQNFTGFYKLSFDAWTNYDVNERINGGSAGTTEFIGGGIGYDNVAADVGVGAQIIATNDGGSGSDWRAFADGSFISGADMFGESRNGFVDYYADFLPGVAPPAGQAQDSADPGVAGSPGFQWITYHIENGPYGVLVSIEKPGGDTLPIVLIDDSLDLGDGDVTTDGNIGLVYADFFSSVTARPDLTFGLIDNVVVMETPEPASFGLALIGLGALAARRRR